jgi:hypothetical protein
MDSILIDDPEDRRYPFKRALFEDPYVLYHGTWSTWAARIDHDGLMKGFVPFDWVDIATIFEANQAVGRGSFLRMFLGEAYPHQPPTRDLFFSANFWTARAYATSGGGEAIRKGIEEAQELETVCNEPGARTALIAHWKAGLRQQPGHQLTEAALQVLQDDVRLAALCDRVRDARIRLAAPLSGGHPVVYAVSVAEGWFGKVWEQHVSGWREGRREVNMRSVVPRIAPDRLLGKVGYPNGTDPNFIPTWCSTWEQVVELTG